MTTSARAPTGEPVAYEYRSIATLDDAVQLLMQAAFSPEEVPGLRRFLAWQGETDLWRDHDDALLHLVARMLLDRRLMLMRRRRLVRRSGSAGPAPGGAAVPFTPSMLRQPSDAGPSAASAPALDLLQAIDQDAQAAVLRLAAEQGVPFCEECAKRQRERAREPEMA